MNCLALEVEGRLLVIDCGLTFPDHEPGVEVIHPDFDYLLDRTEDIEAVVLTHGHEDHIGALPFLLRDLQVPLLGPPYALALAELRLEEHGLDWPETTELQPGRRVELGPFTVTPYRVNHSLPDCLGLIIHSAAGTVVHSGDYKFDARPVDGQHFDEQRLREAGDAGVDLLLSDSTNIESPGHSGQEAPVAEAVARHLEGARGRAVVCLFASNVHRLDGVLGAAASAGRRVLPLGRSLLTHLRISTELGMLQNAPSSYVTEAEAKSVPRDQLLVLATGSQGEPGAALNRLASGRHRALKLEPGDSVLMSARIIPGRERSVTTMTETLERQGIRVTTRRDDPALHVSGHAHREEQTRLIELVRPRAFMPVHGTVGLLRRHAELARELGVPRVVTARNGQVVELDATGLRRSDEPPVVSGRIHVQRGVELSAELLRDRTRMANAGLVLLVLRLDGNGRLLSKPHVSCRGVVDELTLADLDIVRDAERAVERALRNLGKAPESETVQLAAERAVRRVFRDALGWRPLIHSLVDRADP